MLVIAGSLVADKVSAGPPSTRRGRMRPSARWYIRRWPCGARWLRPHDGRRYLPGCRRIKSLVLFLLSAQGRRAVRRRGAVYRNRTPCRQRTSLIFAELFERAKHDGKLPKNFDVGHVAHVAQSLVNDGARHWAADIYGRHSFAEIVGRDITALVNGYSLH